MATLNTFGAILTHAINQEGDLSRYYEAAGVPELAKAADKRRTTLERIRREYVVEITLEPIEGLDAADYEMNLADTSAAGRRAVAQTAERFYTDVAPKINVRQAQRALEKCGRQYAELVASE